MLQVDTLTDRVSRLLLEQITSGALPPGCRLPTEERLAAEFGVSRSVVREAVSRLKAEGLVSTRQGVGASVTSPLGPAAFRIRPDTVTSPEDVVAVFELRLAVESEAAALAADRSTTVQRLAIRTALRRLEAVGRKGEDGVAEDLSFHRAIVSGSNNRRFDDFVEFLGRHIVAQAMITRRNSEAAEQLAVLQPEHRAICDAIMARDVDAARAAARNHFRNGIARLLAFAPATARPRRPGAKT